MIAPKPAKTDLLQGCLRASRLGLMDQARDLAHRLIASAPAADAPTILDARIRLIWIEFQDGHHATARSVAHTAIAEAAALGDVPRESIARSHYARLLAEDLETSRAADEALTALRLARVSGDALALSVALVVPAIICSRVGLYEAAVELADQAVLESQRSGDSEAIAHSISNYGSLHADYLYRFAIATPEQRRAYLDIAITQSRRATHYARSVEDSEMQRLPGYNLVEFLLLAGEKDEAAAVMRETDAAPGRPSRRSEVQRGHVLAHLILARDDRRVAIAALRESLDRCVNYPFLELAVFAARNLVDVLAEIGDFEAAYEAHRRFDELYCLHVNEDDSRHMQTSILHDRIEEMRLLIAAEEGRASRLQESNAKLAEAAERLARETLEDALTGVGNRRQLDLTLTELATRRGGYAIAILDADHFKEVNDRYSHTAGDAVLRGIAQVVRDALVRSGGGGDSVARLGGEEFAVILPNRSDVLAAAVCEDLREAVQRHNWSGVAPGLAVTISIGIASSDESEDAAGCLAMADRRLYEAKRAGRNRVVWAGCEPPLLHEHGAQHTGLPPTQSKPGLGSPH
jgi:diguanylate cyclase (GGDEF)-like protein